MKKKMSDAEYTRRFMRFSLRAGELRCMICNIPTPQDGAVVMKYRGVDCYCCRCCADAYPKKVVKK